MTSLGSENSLAHIGQEFFPGLVEVSAKPYSTG